MKIKECCKFYVKEIGCKALKNLYCEIDDKPCKFFKPKATAAEEKQVTSKL